eukprot:scaffold75019_cov20-Tisochrysis_lutea.AAC.2
MLSLHKLLATRSNSAAYESKAHSSHTGSTFCMFTASNPKACESKAQSRTHNTTHSVYAPSASATWRRVKARLTQEYAVWMKELEGRLPSVHRACVA